MAVSYLNQQQSTFSALMHEGKLTGADVARAKVTSAASVSKILSGKQTPRQGTIEHLRRVVAERIGKEPGRIELPAPSARGAKSEELKEAPADKLEFIRRTNPTAYQAIESMIDMASEKSRQLKKAAKK